MGRYNFFQRNHHVVEMSKLEKQTFLDWYAKHFGQESSEGGRRLTVRIFNPDHKDCVADDRSYSDGDLLNFREEVDVFTKTFKTPQSVAKLVKGE